MIGVDTSFVSPNKLEISSGSAALVWSLSGLFNSKWWHLMTNTTPSTHVYTWGEKQQQITREAGTCVCLVLEWNVWRSANRLIDYQL